MAAPVLRRVFDGVLRFNSGDKPAVVRRVPRHVMVNCVDPRVDPARYAGLETAELFALKNPGNLLPPAPSISAPANTFLSAPGTATEPATLELAFNLFSTVKSVSKTSLDT